MRSKIELCLALVIAITPSSIYMQPNILWEKTFGGSGSDRGHSVQQTIEGGYIIAGSTASFGAGFDDVWLIKTDNKGDTLWTRTYGGFNLDWAQHIEQTSDSGYVVTGVTCSMGEPNGEVWLLKANKYGDTLWTRTFRGEGRGAIGKCVQQTADGGYIITGSINIYSDGSTPDLWLIKIDSEGETLWTKAYGGKDWDYGNDIIEISDSGFVIVGSTSSFGSGERDVWLIRTDHNGDSLWTRTFGGTDGDYGNSVCYASDGGYIITGSTKSYGSVGYDVWLIKTDTAGNMLWTRTYGGRSDDGGESVKPTADEGYIISGTTQGLTSHYSDIWMIKTDADGDTLWTKRLGGSYYDVGPSIQQTTDGGFVIAGYTRSFGAGDYDVWLVRLCAPVIADTIAPAAPRCVLAEAGDGQVILIWAKNTESDFLRYRIYGGTTVNSTTAIDSTESAFDTTRTISGLNNGTTYYFRIAAVDTALNESDFSNEVSATPAALAVDESSAIPTSFALHPAHPNPFNPSSTIRFDLPHNVDVRIVVYDILGREVARLVDRDMTAGYHQVIWNGRTAIGREVPTGIYIARLVTPEFTKSIKMLLLK